MTQALEARARALGQAERRFLVAVRDVNGRPVPGAEVRAGAGGGASRTVFTDSRGDAVVALPPGGWPVDFTVVYDAKYVTNVAVGAEAAARGDTVFVRIPICVAEPLLTVPELLALGGAAALTGAGFMLKSDILKVTGEVLFGAAAFTAIYRHSCL
jgi:hypothetical protein